VVVIVVSSFWNVIVTPGICRPVTVLVAKPITQAGIVSFVGVVAYPDGTKKAIIKSNPIIFIYTFINPIFFLPFEVVEC